MTIYFQNNKDRQIVSQYCSHYVKGDVNLIGRILLLIKVRKGGGVLLSHSSE